VSRDPRKDFAGENHIPVCTRLKKQGEKRKRPDTWEEVDVAEVKTKILPGTSAVRRKHTSDGVISKFKDRYCVRGDLQEGKFETYAPVVAFSTVRLLLVVLAMTLDWCTCSIDFSNAFVQVVLDEPVWIHLARGFNSTRRGTVKNCLRLCRSQSVRGPLRSSQALVRTLVCLLHERRLHAKLG
jgi:hypothetical protein